MPGKRRITVDAGWLYRRLGTNTIYARDELGRYNAYHVNGQQVSRLPGGITTLGPIYGRVNFANDVRFNGQVRSQYKLATAFATTANALKISTGWIALPQTRSASRRQTNQGMNLAMIALTGGTLSATQYAAWYDGRNANVLDATQPWEWCHLLAHSMGGADNQTNIVAARKGNNSEQLAIETALQMYRMEQCFDMNITAALLDGADGQHIGNVIEYEVRCTHGGNNFSILLDCLNAPNPSAIHYYDVLRSVAQWANQKLVQASRQLHNNAVSGGDKRRIEEWIEQHP